MVDKEKIIEWIEDGKQLGKRFSFKVKEEIIWSSVGIQKINDKYVVYIDEIEEKNIFFENYLRDEIKKFDRLVDALDFIEKETRISIDNLNPCKGQKIFNKVS